MTYKTVEEAIDAAYEALNIAEKLADERGDGFSFEPAYGMGGTYYTAEETERYDGVGYNLSAGEAGWVSSSEQC